MCVIHSHCSVDICFIYSDSSAALMSHSVSSQNIRIFSSRMWWHKQFVLNLTKTRMAGSCYPNFCAHVNTPTQWQYKKINETQRNVSSSCQDSQRRQTLRVCAGNLLGLLSVGCVSHGRHVSVCSYPWWHWEVRRSVSPDWNISILRHFMYRHSCHPQVGTIWSPDCFSTSPWRSTALVWSYVTRQKTGLQWNLIHIFKVSDEFCSLL